jgi:hypothetical protein
MQTMFFSAPVVDAKTSLVANAEELLYRGRAFTVPGRRVSDDEQSNVVVSRSQSIQPLRVTMREERASLEQPSDPRANPPRFYSMIIRKVVRTCFVIDTTPACDDARRTCFIGTTFRLSRKATKVYSMIIVRRLLERASSSTQPLRATRREERATLVQPSDSRKATKVYRMIII